MADIQKEMVKSEQGVNIAQLEAQAQIKQAEGEAESIWLRAQGEAKAIRVTGDAKAQSYLAGAKALGSRGYTAVQLMQIIGEQGVRVVPDIAVSGNAGGGSGMAEALLGMVLQQQIGPNGKKATGEVPAATE